MSALVATTTHSFAHPETETDHGVNATTHATLWAGDTDETNLTLIGNATEESPSGMRLLAAGTDIPLDAPPKAVEQWNVGELSEFPVTGPGASVYPTAATPVSGRFIADAHATIFTVQPSTHARLAVGEQPLYVADRGAVLGVVDYRVAVPDDIRSALYRESWELTSYTISEIRLLVDGAVVARAEGTRTPTLEYDLVDAAGEPRTLTLEADIDVSFTRTTTAGEPTCPSWNNSSSCTTTWTTSVRTLSESLTVSDAIDVVGYDLDVSGARTQYPNGDVGVVLYKNQPWLGYALGDASVSGVWRFYSARDPAWDTLTRADGTETTTEHSSLHPLQVNAYPIETGPTAAPRSQIAILDTYGDRTMPPPLPPHVNLDVLTEAYTASYGIATRSSGVEPDSWRIVARGLVGRERVTLTPSELTAVPMHRSNLTLTIDETTDETVVVRASLRDAETGEAIDTADRGESLRINGREVDTGPDGTVTVTLDREVGGVSARYEPRPWWDGGIAYTGDSDVVSPRGVVLETVQALFEFAVPLGLVLFGTFIIDRLTGWSVWPPWRGM
ncbi:hypothetical protein [Halobaculum limi]|uniref:hypothetical protein n=1 Tax=Halobaculum limi TaxID=3031916 RepID=UPI002406A25F|nr:hypothetical protein [Halobaculum sp. YSMS11]